MGKSAKMCEIVSDLEHLSEDTIKNVIGSQGSIEKWLYILHDKDKKEDGTLKSPHWHIYLKFNNARQFQYIAKWFDVAENFVNSIKGAYGDSVEYSIHQNAPDKYQYDIAEVKSNFDVESYIENFEENKAKKQGIKEILYQIDTGEIKEYNITDKLGINEYVMFERQIRRAFDYKLIQQSRKVDRNMEVIYIFGGSGCGKTTFAKMIAKKQGYEVFASSSSNDCFYGYKGQECIILDDLRGSSFPFADLLKILDNNTNTTAQSRYRNVCLQCDLIIITSIKTPEEFVESISQHSNEDTKQFFRRVSQIVRLTQSYAFVKTYNTISNTYDDLTTFPNPVKDYISQFRKGDDYKIERANKLFGFCKDDLKNYADSVGSDPEVNSDLPDFIF